MLRLIEDQAQIGVLSIDLRKSAVAAQESSIVLSEGLRRIAGLPHANGDDIAVLDLIHPADWSIREEMRAALCSGLSVHRELRIVRPDRTVRWVEVKADVVLCPGGQPERIDGIVIDITSAGRRHNPSIRTRRATRVSSRPSPPWSGSSTATGSTGRARVGAS